jgi:hypothetical protein
MEIKMRISNKQAPIKMKPGIFGQVYEAKSVLIGKHLRYGKHEF